MSQPAWTWQLPDRDELLFLVSNPVPLWSGHLCPCFEWLPAEVEAVSASSKLRWVLYDEWPIPWDLPAVQSQGWVFTHLVLLSMGLAVLQHMDGWQCYPPLAPCELLQLRAVQAQERVTGSPHPRLRAD